MDSDNVHNHNNNRWKQRPSLYLLGLFYSPLALSNVLDESMEPGVSGYVQFLPATNEFTSLEAVSDNNEKIDSLNQDAKSETEAIPAFLWSLDYTLDNRQTQLYIGTPEENITEGTALFELGILHQLTDGTLLKAAYLPKIPGIASKVWKDPYKTGSKREKTDSEVDGFLLSADYLFDSPLSLQYGFAKQQIKDERSGQSLLNQPTNGLTNNELSLLRRSAEFQQTKLTLTLPLEPSFVVIPSILYTVADAEGDAFSYDRLGADLLLLYTTNNYEFNISFSFATADYDRSHPVFNKVREDENVSMMTGISFIEPFDWKDIHIDGIISYSRQESNIKFYDEESTIGAVGISYQF